MMAECMYDGRESEGSSRDSAEGMPYLEKLRESILLNVSSRDLALLPTYDWYRVRACVRACLWDVTLGMCVCTVCVHGVCVSTYIESN